MSKSLCPSPLSVVKLGQGGRVLGDYSLLGPRPRRFVVNRHITCYSVLLGLLGQLGDYSVKLGQKIIIILRTNIFYLKYLNFRPILKTMDVTYDF